MLTVTYVPVPAWEWMAPRGVRHLEGWVAEVLVDRALQLPQGKDTLHQSGCADRVTASDQTAGRIDGAFRLIGQLQPVIDAGHEGLAADGEFPAFPIAA